MVPFYFDGIGLQQRQAGTEVEAGVETGLVEGGLRVHLGGNGDLDELDVRDRQGSDLFGNNG